MVKPAVAIPHIAPVMTADMNDNLCRPFSEEEISDALFQIGPLKAPGPDGLPARFFQRNWGLLKLDIIKAVQEFFVSKVMPDNVNDTTIVLIPKKSQPECLKDYRPISLCNVVYKIVSKCLANRLRPLLQEIISESQSAFVPGCLITDNALITFECLHAMQSSGQGGEFCAYKLDLAKAYDRVDWKFLECAMQAMGFDAVWIRWIMACVTTVRYRIKFNGELLPPFLPSRGLRQGNPISPYLFLFVADCLSKLMKNREDSGLVRGIQVCRSSPSVSHLLFADDTLLFFKASSQQAHVVRNMLAVFQRATGQLLSPEKSTIMFGPSVAPAVQEEIRDILHVHTVAFEARYLGLPTPQGRMKREAFQPIEEKLAKRVMDGSDRCASSAGKEVLIKSVAQPLPTYLMGVFKLNDGLCEELMRKIRKFWWGSKDGKHKTHWCSWERMLRTKTQGGLGFRDMKAFNQALLARQSWRLIQFPDSLCARILKAKYYPRGHLIDTVFTGNASPTWRAVEHGLELLKKGLIWRVGDGTAIRIWRDNWIPRPPILKVLGKKAPRTRVRWVTELIDPRTNSWDIGLLKALFFAPDVDMIRKIKLPRRGHEDLVAWHYEDTGIFSVRSAYRLAFNDSHQAPAGSTSTAPAGDRSLWNLIWKADVPPRVRHFAWRVATGTLPTTWNKWKRKLGNDGQCKVCGTEPETEAHALL